MYALSVQINNEQAVVGGADDLGVLIANVECSGKLGTATVLKRPDKATGFRCRLGGLTSRSTDTHDEHLTWVDNHDLKVGDVVRIEIVDVNACAPAIRSRLGRRNDDAERKHFELCKREYFSLRAKYEADP